MRRPLLYGLLLYGLLLTLTVKPVFSQGDIQKPSYTIRDGRAVEMRAFADHQQALNWARSKSLSDN